MRSILDDALFGQRLLAAAGLYKGRLDGDVGPITKAALQAFLTLSDSYAKALGKFDARSEEAIYSLLPKAQSACRKAMALAKAKYPLTVKVLSGTRSYAEQHKLFLQRPRVTKADAGQSNHNFGIAFDIGIFDGKTYFTGATRAQEKAYDDLAKLIKGSLGFTIGKDDKLLDWGGDWKSIVDKPHYELHTGKSVSQCRALLEAGKPYV